MTDDRDVFTGFFEYRRRMDGWDDSFTVVDFDGMPFALDSLRRFEGRGVRITIELAPEVEAEAEREIESGDAPFIYRAIGATAAAYKVRRLASTDGAVPSPEESEPT